MTKDQAIVAMRSGKKVTHEYFSDGEWITMSGYMIVTEEGFEHPADEFWRHRQGSTWIDGGWSIIYEQAPEEVHVL